MVEQCSVGTCHDKAELKGMCRTHYHRAWRLGDPEAPLTRNSPNATLAERFWSFTTRGGDDECWPWTGRPDIGGYGTLRTNGARPFAHRAAYELLVGPIPAGMTLDHLCHTRDLSCPGGKTCPHRRCVNPAHLEPVPGRVNRLRGRSFSAVNAQKTHCPKGHPYDEANTYVSSTRPGRICRICNNAAQRAYRARKAARMT